jgi:hypothetical protein
MNWQAETNGLVMVQEDEMTVGFYDSMDGPSEEEVYLSGKILLFCHRQGQLDNSFRYFQESTRRYCSSLTFFHMERSQKG